ncbi:hypothetical protein LAZ67_5003828 [Cordylochernes scorpioides]|uniref:Uncharacterized protein n=1 Tax=Cordylochernes scorpioides TaxID=51811 RepID=A0ABY6KHK8_9ARAC|nr:hypothetical protein LAZ67_5003828 [Cordylochernes scorpioides]
MEDASMGEQEKLLRLPNYLVRQPLELFRKLRLADRSYFQVRQILLDLYPESSEASFAKYFAMKLTGQANLKTYYREKTAMGLQLGLPQEVILETLTEGLPFNDQRLVRVVPPENLGEWFRLVQRIHGPSAPTTRPREDQPPTMSGPYHSTPRRPGAWNAPLPPSNCKFCGARHWHSECRRRPVPTTHEKVRDGANSPKTTNHDSTTTKSSQGHPSRAALSRLSPTSLESSAAPSSGNGQQGREQCPPKEIKATRANIAEAKARQTSSTHENYIFVELCPDIPDYSYLRAMGKLVGGPGGITQFNRMNGHYIVGLATKNLARRLVEGGLEIDGTTLKASWRTKPSRMPCDPMEIPPPSPPILVKMGEYTFTDGRREAFVLLHDGINLEKLPHPPERQVQGRQPAGLPLLWHQVLKMRETGPPQSQLPSARQAREQQPQASSVSHRRKAPPPSSSSAAKEADTCARNTGVPCPTGEDINRGSSDPLGAPSCRPEDPRDLAQPAPVAIPAPMAAPRPLEPAILPLDIEMSEEERTSTPSTPSKGKPAIVQLREHLEKLPSIAIDHSGLLG